MYLLRAIKLLINERNMKTISKEKLDSLTSRELLNLLNKSFMARTLVKKDSKISSKDIGKIQREIVKTLWNNFPEVARFEGLKKVRN